MHRAFTSRTSLLTLIFLYCLQYSSPVVNASPAPLLVPANSPRQVSPTTISSPLSTNPVSPASISFTDGGGSGFSPPAILWIIFAIVLGLPLAIAGVRLWRITSGIGVGLAFSILIWASFVNSTSGTSLAANPTTSDLFLSLFVWAVFGIGFILGFLRWGIVVGISLLGADAGVALGIMIALLRPGLLIPIYALNIVPMILLGVLGALGPIWWQRIGVVVSTSTIGVFFLSLAVDLVLHKQSGMSLGLRFLLDRNKVHLSATLSQGYHPTLATIITIGASIFLIPILSFAQHKIWKEPFDRSPESLEAHKISVKGKPIVGPGEEGYDGPENKVTPSNSGANMPPQHTRLQFPSIVPSLPGKVSNEYIAAQNAYRSNPPPPMQSFPGAGVGRRPFVGYWGEVVNAAKRMSNRMSMGFSGARRMSAFLGVGGGTGRRASQMSVPSIYSVATLDNRPGQSQAGAGARLAVARNDETPSSVYGGVQQIPQTKPLRLPNRTANATNARSPLSTYPANNGYAQPPPQQASLRTARGWNQAGGSGLSPIQSQPSTPMAPRTPVTPQAQAQMRTPTGFGQRMAAQQASSRNVGIPSTPRDRAPPAARVVPPRPQQQQQQTPQQGTGRNRLKTTTRYNLL